MSRYFVVQFSGLDQMLQEVRKEGIDAVRVWPGTFTVGSPARRYEVVNVQAIGLAQGARWGGQILSTVLVIGAYEELYGRPFGPSSEARSRAINEHVKEAVKRVRDHVTKAMPAVSVRSGHIHTGLSGRELQVTSWSGFKDIYDKIKEVGGENN